MKRQIANVLVGIGCLGLFARLAPAAKVTAEKTDEGVVIKADGKLFAVYVLKSNTKPILYPLIGPTGKAVTRHYPMKTEAVAGEKQDHPHHRSCWYTHGDIGGIDFWGEEPTKANQDGKTLGQEVHRKFTKIAESGDTVVLIAETDYLAKDGHKVCEDERKMVFGADADRRWFDFQVIIKASEGELKFGDTKEGGFGVRVAGTMSVNSNLGGKIVNSEDQTNDDAWGKPAEWVDYHGPVEDETLGVAIMNHPTSFRFPTHWHVRTYGLFTANPFGLKAFTGKPDADGSHTVPKGGTLTLRYRVLLHKGDEKQGEVAKRYEEYAKTK